MNYNKSNGFDYELGREDSRVGWVFGVLKGMGIDTKGMSVEEAFDTLNERTKVSGCKKKVQEFKNKKDGTYDYKTGKPVKFDKGYQVSFLRPEASDMSDKDWDKIATWMGKETGSSAYIGVYLGEPEISFRCKSRKKAIELMSKFNQESVMDWQKHEAHPDDYKEYLRFNTNMKDKVDYGKILREI